MLADPNSIKVNTRHVKKNSNVMATCMHLISSVQWYNKCLKY